MKELIGWMDRTSLLKCESGRIAIAVPCQASRVIPLVFGVSQHLSLAGRQLFIITRFLSVLAGREVALFLRVRSLFRFLGSEFGMVAFSPAVSTILCVAQVFRHRP